MKNILCTGSKGQLGCELFELSKNFSQYNFYFTDISDLDISNFDSLRDFFF